GEGAQAALFPTQTICFTRLRTAGSSGVYRGSGRRKSNAFGESADRGDEASGGLGGAAACGVEVLSASSAGAVHAGGSVGGWTARAGAGAGNCGGDSRAREKG